LGVAVAVAESLGREAVEQRNRKPRAESVARIESRAESEQESRERSSVKAIAELTETGERAQEKW
jgi:hypothetical protein